MFAKKTMLSVMTASVLALGVPAAGAASILPARATTGTVQPASNASVKNGLLSQLATLKYRVQNGIRTAQREHRSNLVRTLQRQLGQVEQLQAQVRAVNPNSRSARTTLARLSAQITALTRLINSELR